MSVFIDLQVRRALAEHLLSIGSSTAVSNERVLDLSPYGLSNSHTVQIVAGEVPTTMQQSLSWAEAFLTKTPQFLRTSSESGLSYKLYQYVLWIKTKKDLGLFINEALCGAIEEHFPNNKHIVVGDNILTIIKTHQQPIVSADNETGRLFNRVYIDCEIYYKNNN
jgi:hypothetical protein